MNKVKTTPKKMTPTRTQKSTFIIAGGRVIDPASGLNKVADIYVQGGKIFKIETQKLISKKKVSSSNEEIIPAWDNIVTPGLIDMHVHLREPGREDEETIVSGSEAGVAGGFTSICCMPNTQPPLDNQEAIKFVYERAKFAPGKVFCVGSVTKGQKGEELTEIGELVDAGAVAITDDGKPVSNSEVMRRALEYTKMFDIPVIDHCEDLSLSKDGIMHESFTSTVIGLKGIPALAEEIMVARNIKLAAYTGGRVHIAHLSTAGSVELVREAKKKKIKVTCEVTPHHFTLNEELIASYDTNLKMNPPLRSKKDILAIKAGLKDGTIDCIATDHAPHSIEEKDVEFELAPFGIIGLETALGLVVTELIEPGILSWSDAVAKMTVNPARILKLNLGQIKIGFPADLTIIDPKQSWTVDVSAFKSKSKNSPFGGRKLKGKVQYTIVNGKVVYSG